MASRFVVLACLWLAASFAAAQDLKDASLPAPKPFVLDLAASAELRSGNVSSVAVSDQLLARYDLGAHYVSLSTSHAFAKQGGERFLNAFRALAQYRHGFELGFPGFQRVGPAALFHYERDEFRRREHLLNVGGGGFVDLFRSDRVRWNVTAGYVFEFEEFAQLTSPTDPSMETLDSGFRIDAHRAWLASEFGVQLWERVHLGEDLLIQVPLDHCACDTRVYTTSFLRVYGNDYLALQTAFTVIYDAGPPRFGDIKSFDAILRSSLVFSL
jgi:hypothetical protein